MATYVVIIKEHEDDNSIVIRYGPEESRLGKAIIEKSTKSYKEIEPVPDTKSKFYFNCAVGKVIRHLMNNSGQKFPERDFYAS
jgi:hypothetical protein